MDTALAEGALDCCVAQMVPAVEDGQDDASDDAPSAELPLAATPLPALCVVSPPDGLLVAVALSFGLVLLSEGATQRMSTPENVRKLLGLRVLVAVPHKG